MTKSWGGRGRIRGWERPGLGFRGEDGVFWDLTVRALWGLVEGEKTTEDSSFAPSTGSDRWRVGFN